MQFRVLGVPEVHDDVADRWVPLTSPKQRQLLGALLARPGVPVPTARLIEELWSGRAPGKAVNALQAHVSRLRQLLIEAEPSRANTPRLMARDTGYVLQARPEELDSARFRLATARAVSLLGSDPRAARVLLKEALELWRGPAMAGSTGGPLCAGAAAELEEERLSALEALYDVQLRLGPHREAVGELRRLTAAHPGRERFGGGRPWEADLPPVTAAAAPGPGDGGELLRLRARVDELVDEQRLLRSQVERLSLLLTRRGRAPGALTHR
ncbi:BTAD domain-containing putative transcriptional regulator [Streptomyces sp. NPDC016640]|uniref:AfsR/SARP family transcriptional regulator n=1 Tax=Streptomyces sp. NPDC016640 TaxID=3364969 RepID=UPI0036FDF688